MTAYGTIETAVEAVKAGAYDYITKPVNQEELLILLDRALEHRALRQEVQQLRSSLDEKFGFEAIIGRSKTLMHVLDLAARAPFVTLPEMRHRADEFSRAQPP